MVSELSHRDVGGFGCARYSVLRQLMLRIKVVPRQFLSPLGFQGRVIFFGGFYYVSKLQG